MNGMRYFVVRTECDECVKQLNILAWEHKDRAFRTYTVTELTTPEAIAAAERLVEGEK